MATESTVFSVNNEIKEVEREIQVIKDLTVDKVAHTFCASKEVKITCGELDKMQSRLYDLLFILKNAPVNLPFPCRNGE